MIYVQKLETRYGTAVSCELRDNSLAEMREMDGSFCMGWTLGALGRWIARSNYPRSSRVKTNAVLESLQVHLPHFTHSNLLELLELPCLATRSQYLNQNAQAKLAQGIDRAKFTLGWALFQKFDAKNAVADAKAINLETEKSEVQVAPSYL